jgi:thioredoxin 1
MLSPVVDELAQEMEGKVAIGKLNVDDNPQVCEQFGIMSIPTLLFFKNGELVDRMVGAHPKTEIQNKLNALL